MCGSKFGSIILLAMLLVIGGLVACEEKTCMGIEGEDACRAAGCDPMGGSVWTFISADGHCLARRTSAKVCVKSAWLTAGLADYFWFRRRQADGTTVYFGTSGMYRAADWEVLEEGTGPYTCDVLDPGHSVPLTDVAPDDWYPFRPQPTPEYCEALRDEARCRAAGCRANRSDWFVVSADDTCLARHDLVFVCLSSGTGSDDMNSTWYTRTNGDGTRDFFRSEATYVFGWTKAPYHGDYDPDICEVLDPGSTVPVTDPPGDGWYPFE